MKRTLKSLSIATILLSFAASCQQELEPQAPEQLTHTVTFVAGEPETKTVASIDGTVVKYSWTEDDALNDRFRVFENANEASLVVPDLKDNLMYITATFDGEVSVGAEYKAFFNAQVKAVQESSENLYDQDCDVLVAKPTAGDIDYEGIVFSFKREVAFGKMTLKGLNNGKYVSKVVLEATDGKILAAEYDIENNQFLSTGSSSIELNARVEIAQDQTASLFFVTVPVEDAKLKISVETVDESGETAAIYSKTFTKPISFTRGDIKGFGVSGMEKYVDPHKDDEGWFRVEDVRALAAGDVIRLGRPEHNVVAGQISSDNKYFTKLDSQYSEDGNELVRIGGETIDLTLGGTTDAWTLANNESIFCCVDGDIKKDQENPKPWKISIAAETFVASISNGSYTIKYNPSSPRFKTYNSGQQNIYIYKKYGNPADKGLLAENDVCWKIDETTVTSVEVILNAKDNVFPVVSTTSAGARTFSSSATDVATVDPEGIITLLSSGSTTIKVEIAETEEMKAGSAEYTLNVMPAIAGFTDVLTREWTGIINGAAYSDWSGKIGSFSGNTYSGNSAGGNNSIQLRTKYSKEGIVVTSINSKNYIARKVEVKWNSETASERTLDIYGKNEAYSSAEDLYSENKKGTLLGSIKYGTGISTSLNIVDGSYKYLGIRSNDGALYLDNIQITWEEPKPSREALAFYIGESAVTEALNAVVGDEFTAPVLKDANGVVDGATYSSNNTDVAEVESSTGVVTLKKKGEVTITATVPADETYSESKVSYTINVANRLSSISLDENSAQPLSFFKGDEFDFTGIIVNVSYNDGTAKVLTSEDLTIGNFSGFDSSSEAESQTITVSYTEDGNTRTCQYAIAVKEAHNIIVPGTDAKGNSVTVDGGASKAAARETVTLLISPATGYYVTSVKVNGGEELKGNIVDGKLEITMPASDITVTAEFSNLYTVTFEPNPADGSVSVNGDSTGSVQVAAGETVALLGVPSDDGLMFRSWTVTPAVTFTSGSAYSALASFTMPAENVAVAGEFTVKSNSYVRIKSLQDITPGTYIIINGGYYLPSSTTSSSPSAKSAPQVVDDEILPSLVADEMKWYLTSTGTSNQFYVKNADGNFLYETDSNTGLRVGSTNDKWIFAVNSTDYFSMKGVNNSRYCAKYDTGLDWRSYTSATHTNYANGGKLALYRLQGSESGSGTTKLSSPAKLSCTTQTENSLTFTWDPVANASGYQVSLDGGVSYETTQTSTEYTWTGLSAGTTKTLYVKAIGDGSSFTDSDAVSATGTTTSASSGSSEKEYTLTITKDSFNTTSYAANNNDKTTKAVASDGTNMDVTWYSNAIMQQSQTMQWQSGKGYIYNKTDLGDILSVTVNSTAGSFTTYYGTSQNPTSGTTVGNGFFTVKVGSSTGKTSSVVIKFKK